MTQSSPSRSCVVIGMHRCGTSLIARAVNLLGYSVGKPELLLGPAKDNPRGFWEARPVVWLNDEVLAGLGGTWDAPPTLPESWDTADVDRRKPGAVLDRVIGGTERWMVKDPRMSLVLPFWELDHPFDQVVLAVREPQAAAASLRARNGIDEEWAMYLWIRYMAGAAAVAHRAVVVSFEDAMADSATFLSELADELGVSPDAAAAKSFVEYADDSLQHHPGPGGGATDGLNRLAGDIRSQLLGDQRAGLEEVLPLIARGTFDGLDYPGAEQMRTVHDGLRRVRTAVVPRVHHASRARRLAEENRGLRMDRNRFRDDLRRLKGRRSVKTALKLAEAARPGYQALRRLRGVNVR